jgi:coenzyme F420-reducing hydrogenase beta subunit
MDKYGFYKPNIDYDKCTDCGLCVKICPVLSPKNSGEYNYPRTLAGWSLDENLRSQSSSGGIFSEVAKPFLAEGGHVFGAGFDDLELGHMRVDSPEDLKKIIGSKYIQSNIGDTYKEIVELAKEGEVLFCGTPCQVSALENIISNMDGLHRVYTIDLICHGVASTKVFRSYLDSVSRAHGSDVDNISFRDKRRGWYNYGMRIELKDGSEIFQVHSRDPFMIGYLRNIFMRPSCYDCGFSKIPRGSGITLGDYWGAPSRINDKRGVSVILVNDDSGEEMIKRACNIYLTEADLEHVAANNPRLKSGLLRKPKDIDEFYNVLEKAGFQGVKRRFLKPSSTIVMLYAKLRGVIKKLTGLN